MPSKDRQNRYIGKGTLLINGKTEQELGSELFEKTIAQGFIKAMFKTYKMGLLPPEYDCLAGWDFVPK